MAAHPCTQTTATGAPCKNTVTTPGGSCGANHTGTVDLMAALKASVVAAKTAHHAATTDPMAAPPTPPQPDQATPTIAHARRIALGAGYQSLTPTEFIDGLTPWQTATTLQDAADDAHTFADRIADLRSIATGTTPTDPDAQEVPADLHGTALLRRARDHMRKATARLRSTTGLTELAVTDRDAVLTNAQAHAITAAAMFSKAAAEHAANTEPNKLPPTPRTSRKAADASIRRCLTNIGTGPLGTQRARTVAETLRVTSKHLANLRVALNASQPLNAPAPDTGTTDPDELTNAITEQLTAARALLHGESNLTETAKAQRSIDAGLHVRQATHLLKALMKAPQNT